MGILRSEVIPIIPDIPSAETYRAGGKPRDHLLQPLILDEETEKAHRSEFPISDAIRAVPLHGDMVCGMSVPHHCSSHQPEDQDYLWWFPTISLNLGNWAESGYLMWRYEFFVFYKNYSTPLSSFLSLVICGHPASGTVKTSKRA